MQLFVKYLENYHSDWPRLCFAKQDDSGLDLRAAIPERIILKAGTRAVIPNGIQVEMKAETTDFEIQIRPRSGLAAKLYNNCTAVGISKAPYRESLVSLKDHVIGESV